MNFLVVSAAPDQNNDYWNTKHTITVQNLDNIKKGIIMFIN